MEIINELIAEWKKIPLKQKIIMMIGVGVLIMFFNRDSFSQNKIQFSGKIAGENLTNNRDNKGINARDITNSSIVVNNIGDEEEIEEFTIKVLNSSYDNLTKAILYEGEDCLKKIEWKDDGYDNIRKEYTFYMMIKKNRKKKMSIKQQNYLCKNFVIEQSKQNIKPIRLKINCDIKSQNNKCLVREE